MDCAITHKEVDEPSEPKSLSHSLERFWQLDSLGIIDNPHINDDEIALQMFSSSIRFDEDERRYYVKWPWKHNSKDFELTLNRGLAQGRLESQLRKLRANPEALTSYAKTFDDMLERNIIEGVPNDFSEFRTYYMPHHAVINLNKTPLKPRTVFDPSSKAKKSQKCLNEMLYPGPVLLPDISGALIRFRLPPIAVVADVEKAFHMIGLEVSERDVTRFLWVFDTQRPPEGKNLRILRFRRVPFGVISAPFILAATITLCTWPKFVIKVPGSRVKHFIVITKMLGS